MLGAPPRPRDETAGTCVKQAAKLRSNSAMDAAQQDLEQRITELEIKASFAEDLVDHLNEIVVRQQQQIELLARQLQDLKQQQGSGDGGVTVRSLRDELPPHY